MNTKTLTLDEIKELKAKTEQTIAQALRDFEKATGILPECVSVETMGIEEGRRFLLKCAIEVKL